jgi:hypothetical protein
MIRNFGHTGLGSGGARFLIPEFGVGGSTAPHDRPVSAQNAGADLEGLDAAAAVALLEGTHAQGRLPDLSGETAFPGPISEAFYWSNADVHGIQGPVGSGKTTTVMKSRLRRAIQMPRSTKDGVRRYKVLFIRETYRQLWSTTIPSYLETFPKDLGEWSGGRGDPVTHRIRFEDAHGAIEFTAEFMAFGDNIISSMRGVQTTDIVLNEADTMPVDVLTVGIGRIDRFPARDHFAGLAAHLQSYGQIVCDLNAPDEDNWTFTTFHDSDERERLSDELTAAMQADEDAAARHARRAPVAVKPIVIAFSNQPGYGQTGCENLQNLSASYYPRQIAAMRLAGRGDMIARLVHNKVVYLKAGDPVFAEQFNARIHVAETTIAYDPRLPVEIGLDQGFKGAAVIAQRAGFYRWRILCELHLPDKRTMAHDFGLKLRALLAERCPGAEDVFAFGDMAGEHGASHAADENATWNMLVGRAAGFNVRPQRIGTNRIQPRLEAVRAALEAPLEQGAPGLLLDPSCKFLRRGFAARYVWAEETDKNGDKRKVPDKSKTEANVMDGLQYLLLSQHNAMGASPYTNRMSDHRTERQARDGRPPRSGAQTGLQTHFDVLNPYGG